MDILIRILELLLLFGVFFIVMGIVSYIMVYLLMNHEYKKKEKAHEKQTQYLIEVDLNFSYKEWANSRKELEEHLLSDEYNNELVELIHDAINKKYSRTHFKLEEVEKEDDCRI